MYGDYEARTTEAELVNVRVRMVGTGASAPTKIYGEGVTITRQGAGQYRLTFSPQPGKFAGVSDPSRQATTPGDVKGMDFVFGAWTDATSTAAAYFDLYVYDGGAAHDLAALEWLSFDVSFKQTGV